MVGPRWKGETPAGIKKVFQASTDYSLAVFRTQLFNAPDMPNVIKVQSGYKIQPLSAFLHQPAPPAAPAIDFPKANSELVKINFFAYLDFALQFAPPGPEEIAIRAQLARIGIGAGKHFDFNSLDPAHKRAVAEGMQAGQKKIMARINDAGVSINGWRVASWFGERAFYHGDWLLRAAAAQAGIYGNDAAEAMYPMTRWLPNGDIIDTSKHDYTLTFLPDQKPPVNAFASLTMYDGKTQLLIKNPINRYLINSPMLDQMKLNKDGSLTLYIQHASPGKAKESNWLPAPDGPVYLVMRLYWPKPATDALSIFPLGKGTWNPPGIVLVK